MSKDTPQEVSPLEAKIQNVGAWLFNPQVKRQLQLALPRTGITADRMARIVMTEVRRIPALAECSIESLLGAMMEAAQLGLEPGPIGLCYLLPYKGKATFQLGYKGMLSLAWRSEMIASVQSEVVHEADEFVYANGIPPELRHVPGAGDRGEPTHAYAVIGTVAGGWIFRVMTKTEIDAHRDRFSQAFKAKRQTPWITDWDEMACKTVLNRTLKRAPITGEVQRAIDLDTKGELGVPQEIDITPPTTTGAQAPAAPAPTPVPAEAESVDTLPEPAPEPQTVPVTRGEPEAVASGASEEELGF